MSLCLLQYKKRTRDAIARFWLQREVARQNQAGSGSRDQGERASVTAGKNMDGFLELFTQIVIRNGLRRQDIQIGKRLMTLPGFYRPTKAWDFLVVRNSRLIAAIELKSQVGPSFGNNFNNRCEEALGSAIDIHTAFREGAFGESPFPFIGWLMLLEDCDGSTSTIKDYSPHFPMFPEFTQTSYARRYELLCRKLMREKLYTAATLLLSPSSGAGTYRELSELTGMRHFVTALAAQTASAACRD